MILNEVLYGEHVFGFRHPFFADCLAESLRFWGFRLKKITDEGLSSWMSHIDVEVPENDDKYIYTERMQTAISLALDFCDDNIMYGDTRCYNSGELKYWTGKNRHRLYYLK